MAQGEGRRRGRSKLSPGLEGLERKLLLSGETYPGVSTVSSDGTQEVVPVEAKVEEGGTAGVEAGSEGESPSVVMEPAPTEVTDEALMYATGVPRGSAPNERGQTAVFQGRVSGRYRMILASEPGMMSLRGSGTVRGMGGVEARGAVPVTEAAQDSVDLTIQNKKGAVVVRITGDPVETGDRGGTARGRYTIQSGTGAYAGATGSGVVTVRMAPNFRMLGTTGRFAFRFQPGGTGV